MRQGVIQRQGDQNTFNLIILKVSKNFVKYILKYYLNKQILSIGYMQNTYTQTVLFDMPLPGFVINFKNTINSIVVPYLNNIISDIQKKQGNSSIVALLSLIVVLIILKSIADNLFIKRKQTEIATKPLTQPQIDQQIRALANQIKNLKNSLKKIIQQSNKQGNHYAVSTGGKTQGNVNQEDVAKLMEYYKQTAQDFGNLIQFILNSQQSIFEGLKNFKKNKYPAQKTSSHGSKEQNTTQILQKSRQIQQKIQETDTIQPPTQQQRWTPPITSLAQSKPASEVKPIVPAVPKAVKLPAPGPAKKRVPPPPPVPK